MFLRPGADETILRATKPFFTLGAELRKRRLVIQGTNNDGGKPVATTGDSQMRTLSIILAFAFLLAGPSIAGSIDNSLPGIGTFAYAGSAIVTSTPQAVVVAAR